MLDFYKVKSGTAWVEKDLGDVLVILKDYEDLKNKYEDDDYIHVEYFDPSAIEIGMPKATYRKKAMAYDSWLMVGFEDWEAIQIPFHERYRYMIKGFFNRALRKSRRG